MPEKKWIALGVIFACIVVMMRAGLHAPNLIPIGAFALWAGAYLGKRFAVPLVCGLLLVGDAGDIIHGRYAWWLAAAVYAAMLIYVIFGATLMRHAHSDLRKVGASFITVCTGSFAYFMITNGAVWACSALTGTGWYPKTAAGFTTCMIAGIPFWRNDMMINAGGAMVLFGISTLVAAAARKKTVAWQVNASR